MGRPTLLAAALTLALVLAPSSEAFGNAGTRSGYPLARRRAARGGHMLAEAADGSDYFLPSAKSLFPSFEPSWAKFLTGGLSAGSGSGVGSPSGGATARGAGAEASLPGGVGKRRAPGPSEAASAAASAFGRAVSPVVQAIYNKRLRWYNTAIDTHGLAGRTTEALELLQDMITAGVEPEDVTLLIVALACITGGRPEAALGVLEVMAERGLNHPHIDVYAAALAEALRAGDARAAAFLADDARREIVYPHELKSIETEWLRVGKLGWGRA